MAEKWKKMIKHIVSYTNKLPPPHPTSAKKFKKREKLVFYWQTLVNFNHITAEIRLQNVKITKNGFCSSLLITHHPPFPPSPFPKNHPVHAFYCKTMYFICTYTMK